MKRLTIKLPGFTLVELLISLFIITTISAIVFSIFLVSLRATNKSNNLQKIQRDGNFAINQITKMLQFAQDFGGVSTNGNAPFTKTCDASTAYKAISFTANDTSQLLQCIDAISPAPATIALNGQPLVDTTTLSITTCSFTCTQSDVTSPYIIGIKFTIEKTASSSSSLEDVVAVPFQTSLTLRNTRY